MIRRRARASSVRCPHQVVGLRRPRAHLARSNRATTQFVTPRHSRPRMSNWASLQSKLGDGGSFGREAAAPFVGTTPRPPAHATVADGGPRGDGGGNSKKKKKKKKPKKRKDKGQHADGLPIAKKRREDGSTSSVVDDSSNRGSCSGSGGSGNSSTAAKSSSITAAAATSAAAAAATTSPSSFSGAASTEQPKKKKSSRARARERERLRKLQAASKGGGDGVGVQDCADRGEGARESESEDEGDNGAAGVEVGAAGGSSRPTKRSKTSAGTGASEQVTAATDEGLHGPDTIAATAKWLRGLDEKSDDALLRDLPACASYCSTWLLRGKCSSKTCTYGHSRGGKKAGRAGTDGGSADRVVGETAAGKNFKRSGDGFKRTCNEALATLSSQVPDRRCFVLDGRDGSSCRALARREALPRKLILSPNVDGAAVNALNEGGKKRGGGKGGTGGAGCLAVQSTASGALRAAAACGASFGCVYLDCKLRCIAGFRHPQPPLRPASAPPTTFSPPPTTSSRRP